MPSNAQIVADANAAISALNQIVSDLGSTSLPSITAPTTATLTDGSGAVWGFGSTNNSYGYPILKNGSLWFGGYGVIITIDSTGVAWTKNTSNQWWQSTSSGWQQGAGPQ